MTRKKSTPLLKPGRKPGPKLTFICIDCCKPFEVTPGRANRKSGPPMFCGLDCRLGHDRRRAWDPEAIAERFWSFVLCGPTPDDCWEWLGATQHGGYGHFGVGPRGTTNVRAHVFSFKLHGGTLTLSKPRVLHTCDNPPCTNPRHLWGGTQSDNMRDAVAKGRHRYVIPVRKHSH